MRKQPSLKTVKMLFAASGGACAFPGCTTLLAHPETGVMLGEMCHIRGASAGGPRHDPDQEESARSEPDNLLILCATHHSLVDKDPNTYTAEALRQMKRNHEVRVSVAMDDVVTAIDDQQAVSLARQVAVESVDFAIVVALQKELDALKHYFPELEQVKVSPSSTRSYYRGVVATALGGEYRVVTTLLPAIGNLEAAHATADLIRDWSPRFVIVNGIAGGLSPGNQDLGDIVVSDSIVYYEPGKVRDNRVEQRNRQFQSDRTLIGGMLNLSNSEWRQRLPARPDGKVPTEAIPRIHVGPIASGEKVIAAAEEAGRLRASQPNLIAVEMESAGVASAAFSALKKVGFLTIRAICDFADSKKSDNWQTYAAGAAASCLKAFLGSRPVATSEGRWPEATHPVSPEELGESALASRRSLFEHLCNALDYEEFKNFCFLIGVDFDELPGDRKSARVRELILRFERRGQLSVLELAVAEVDNNDRA